MVLASDGIPRPDDSLAAWLEAIEAPTAAPAGGAAAAIAGALAAALSGMVAALTHERPRYAEVHPEAASVRRRAAELRETMLALAGRDAEAFAGFTRALALPNQSAAEREVRTRAKAAALTDGARVQLELLSSVADAAQLASAMAERGLTGAVGDAATAAFLAGAAARSAYWAVRSNLAERRGESEAEEMLVEARGRLDRAEAEEQLVHRLLQERLRAS